MSKIKNRTEKAKAKKYEELEFALHGHDHPPIYWAMLGLVGYRLSMAVELAKSSTSEARAALDDIMTTGGFDLINDQNCTRLVLMAHNFIASELNAAQNSECPDDDHG